ncbi:MAG: hypothetical protein CSA26_08035 [Desulfobacterales bacterium]|nr:MAG: hypothetical protein CSA26_08035 [Desulfobacterales bacterium]
MKSGHLRKRNQHEPRPFFHRQNAPASNIKRFPLLITTFENEPSFTACDCSGNPYKEKEKNNFPSFLRAATKEQKRNDFSII